MKNNNNDNNFDECFWTFVYLLISDDIYLSKEGKFIKEIVNAGGRCESISGIARKLHMQKPMATKICSALSSKNYINITKKGNRRIIRFDNNLIKEAMLVPNKILKD